jgi:hypothetical protein
MSRENEDSIGIGGLAAVINSRLAADSRVAKAVAFSWLCGGVAVAACMLGIGFAFAFAGYSYTLSVKPAAELTAHALVKALERADLKVIVAGKMALSSTTELRLAAGQTVRLNEGATVKLDPNSSIRVVGDLKYDIPQPSKQQLQEGTTIGDHELPFTTYTIFKSTPYSVGQVVTGWAYALSDPLRPKHQYCYYSQSVGKGAQYKYTLARNGSPQRPSPSAKVSFDFDGALSNCIWFSGA